MKDSQGKDKGQVTGRCGKGETGERQVRERRGKDNGKTRER